MSTYILMQITKMVNQILLIINPADSLAESMLDHKRYIRKNVVPEVMQLSCYLVHFLVHRKACLHVDT